LTGASRIVAPVLFALVPLACSAADPSSPQDRDRDRARDREERSLESTGETSAATTAAYELRLHVILLKDDAAGSNCAASPCTTPNDITDFVNFANQVFAPASVHFTFDPTWDWSTLVDWDLNNNLHSNNSGNNWARANQIAASYPGKIVI